MNKVVIIGRITKNPEVRYSTSNVAFGSYTIAVDRPVAKDADKVTDFLYCKVVGKTAEFAEKYLKQGAKIAVSGRIQCDNFTDKEGNKRSTTYIQVSEHEFCESKGTTGAAPQQPAQPSFNPDGFMQIPNEEELPFM
jgi:single-strand DNA-binding protein